MESTMFELAQSIADALRILKPNLKAMAARYKRQDAMITVDGPPPIFVEWVKGGARVYGLSFKRNNDKTFDLEAIMDLILDTMSKHAAREARRTEEEHCYAAHGVLRDAVRNDPRVTTSYKTGEVKRPYRVTFCCKSMTTLSIAIDMLLEFGDSDDPPQPKPTLAIAMYQINMTYFTLRELARLDHLPGEVFDQVLAMCVGTQIAWSGGFIDRVR